MASGQTLIVKIDRLIELFNAKAMDLPDGLFDRKTQFVLNGAPFETLLGQPPTDPLVLMLTRGPAGYRFMTKALQHAVPDARLERGALVDGAGTKAGEVWLSGHCRGTGEAINTVVAIDLRIAAAGWVEVAAATVDAGSLDKLREARLRP
jgi:hypothetical protein